jgi:membrane-bound serine protease (ClpP class)
MDFLLNPNIAYLIVLAGVFLALLAVATPGTGLLEISALFCLVLAGYAIYSLSIHWWALVILVLSVVPLLLAIRSPTRRIYLVVSILLLTIGSVFLFASEDALVSVNPILAIVSSVFAGVAFCDAQIHGGDVATGL